MYIYLYIIIFTLTHTQTHTNTHTHTHTHTHMHAYIHILCKDQDATANALREAAHLVQGGLDTHVVDLGGQNLRRTSPAPRQ